MKALARAVIVIGLGALGCASAVARRDRELESAISWLATSEAVAQAWAANRVPTEYAERVLNAARRDLASRGQTGAADVVSAIDEVIRSRDRDGMEEPLAALRDQRQLLEDTRQREARSQ